MWRVSVQLGLDETGLFIYCNRREAVYLDPGTGGFVVVGTGRNSRVRLYSPSEITDKVIS